MRGLDLRMAGPGRRFSSPTRWPPCHTLLECRMRSEQETNASAEASPLYAEVVVPRHIARSFTYRIPAPLRSTIAVGQLVVVPFGHTTVEGAVIGLSPHLPAGPPATRLKDILSPAAGTPTSSWLPANLFELSRRVAERYAVPWGQCLRLIVPPQPRRRRDLRYVATVEGRAALLDGEVPDALRPLLARIARRAAGVRAATLLASREQQPRKLIERLRAQSWIVETHSAEGRRPVSSVASPFDHPGRARGPLPCPLAGWPDRLADRLHAVRPGKLIVHAPSEPRWALLADSIRATRAAGKSVLIVCGEIAKAEWLVRRLTRLIEAPVQVFDRESHAAAPSGEQSAGHARCLIGTRSVLFAPVPSLGLIWVEGEDDAALKEPREPRYHAREVAAMRGEIDRVLVVLASSHPSLEARCDPDAEHVSVADAGAAPVELIDLRKDPVGVVLSDPLVAAMRESIAAKDGVLLFLNRKGFAGALACRDCNWVPRCPACGVALTYYRAAAKLACRYCGHTSSLPDACPSCRAARLTAVGEGTERVELEVRRLFPDARIVRLDGETVRRTGEARRLWAAVDAGAYDVVIGTQVLFQRGPLPRMGLVGVIQADSGLHVPDFRAAERTYQRLVDATEAVKPAAAGGRVLVQTTLPSHHAMDALVRRDSARFYDEELAARKLLGYPPFCHLVHLSVESKHPTLVEEAAEQWRRRLEGAQAAGAVSAVLGPVPATIKGLVRRLARRQLLLKGPAWAPLCRAVTESVAPLEQTYRSRGVKFSIDVDPVEMAGR